MAVLVSCGPARIHIVTCPGPPAKLTPQAAVARALYAQALERATGNAQAAPEFWALHSPGVRGKYYRLAAAVIGPPPPAPPTTGALVTPEPAGPPGSLAELRAQLAQAQARLRATAYCSPAFPEALDKATHLAAQVAQVERTLAQLG